MPHNLKIYVLCVVTRHRRHLQQFASVLRHLRDARTVFVYHSTLIRELTQQIYRT